MFGVAASALIVVLIAMPYATASSKRQRMEREQRIIEATNHAQGQMAIEKEVRKMAIRHKPRPMKPRKTD